MEDKLNSVGEEVKEVDIGVILPPSKSLSNIDIPVYDKPSSPQLESTEYDIGTIIPPSNISSIDIGRNIADNYDIDSSKFAEAVGVANKLGKNPYDVYADMAASKKELAISAIDLRKLKDDSPIVYDLMFNTTFAGMSHDQLPDLTMFEEVGYRASRFIEGVSEYGGEIADEYRRNDKMIDASKVAVAQMSRYSSGQDSTPTPEEQATLDDYNTFQSSYKQSGNIVRDILPLGAGQIPTLMEMLKNIGIGSAAVGGAIVATGMAASIAQPELAPAIGQVTRKVASTALKLTARGGVFKTSYEVEAGTAFLTLKSMTDTEGNAIPMDIIVPVSRGVGIVSASLEQAPLGMIGKGVKDLLKGGRLNKFILKKAMTNRKLMEKLLQLGTNVTKVGIAEGGTEVLQELVHIIGENVATNTDGSFTDITVNQALSNIASDEGSARLTDSFYAGFTASIGIAGSVGGAVLIADAGKTKRQSDKDSAVIQQVSEAASKVKLRTDNPEEFKTFAQQVFDKKEAVYIDRDVVESYLDEADDGVTDDRGLDVLVEAMNKAQPNDDIKISMSDYATYIANTDHDTALRQNMRLSEEGVSPANSDHYSKETYALLAKVMEKESRQLTEDQQSEYNTLVSQMTKDINSTGNYPKGHAQTMASIVSNYITNVARRTDRPITDVAKEFDLTITSDLKKRVESLQNFGVQLKQDFGEAEISEMRTTPEGDTIAVTRKANDVWKEKTDRVEIADILAKCVNK